MIAKEIKCLDDIIDENTRLKKSILEFGICLKLSDNLEFIYDEFKNLLENNKIDLL